jgi:signal transduction histidine kinase
MVMENDKRNILIVDDDSAVILALTEILKHDYNLCTSKDGKNAIETITSRLPDLVLLDIIMPSMDGFSIIRELKLSDATKNIPIIFITGLGDPVAEEKGLALGAADYIAKPFRTGIVRHRVHNQIKILEQNRLIIEKELADKSRRARSEFLSKMSHDMLTPMNVIMGMTSIMKSLEGSSRLKDYLGEIDDASKQMLRLINDLLEISGNEEGELVLADSVFSFNVMFRNILKEMERIISEKQLTFTSDTDPSIPMLLMGDEKKFAQVIVNLLKNAAESVPHNGEIHFSASVIDEDELTIVMQIEVFYSGSDMADDPLFMPVSKRIVDKMGGEMQVHSEPDKGITSTFTCKVKKR